jgi:hypothetical protein
MLRTKENDSSLTQTDYIHYLYQEGCRHRVHTAPDFYDNLIKFVNSPEGIEGFNKFIELEPEKIGIPKRRISYLYKKAFAR